MDSLRKRIKPQANKLSLQKNIEQITLTKGKINMSKNFRETLKQQLKIPEFTSEWEILEPEFQVIQAMLRCRRENQITQKQLAAITGVTQADISRIESGEANPSLRTLKRLAEGMGMRLKVEFIPETLSTNFNQLVSEETEEYHGPQKK